MAVKKRSKVRMALSEIRYDIPFHEELFERLSSCHFASREEILEKLEESFTFIVWWSINSILTHLCVRTRIYRALVLYAKTFLRVGMHWKSRALYFSVRTRKYVSIRMRSHSEMNISILFPFPPLRIQPMK